jgi:hypothetical protein
MKKYGLSHLNISIVVFAHIIKNSSMQDNKSSLFAHKQAAIIQSIST